MCVCRVLGTIPPIGWLDESNGKRNCPNTTSAGQRHTFNVPGEQKKSVQRKCNGVESNFHHTFGRLHMHTWAAGRSLQQHLAHNSGACGTVVLGMFFVEFTRGEGKKASILEREFLPFSTFPTLGSVSEDQKRQYGGFDPAGKPGSPIGPGGRAEPNSMDIKRTSSMMPLQGCCADGWIQILRPSSPAESTHRSGVALEVD